MKLISLKLNLVLLVSPWMLYMLMLQLQHFSGQQTRETMSLDPPRQTTVQLSHDDKNRFNCRASESLLTINAANQSKRRTTESREYQPITWRVSLDPSRHLLLEFVSVAGYGNQLQCWNLAATLAHRWNRTLWLPPFAYMRSPAHNNTFNLRFQELYDAEKTPIGYHDGKDIPCPQDMPEIRIDPYRRIRLRQPVGSKKPPHGDNPCLKLRCICADSMITSLPGVFPQSWSHWWPYHPRIYSQSNCVLEKIRKTKKVLGLQVRRGDRGSTTAPMLDCTEYGMTLKRIGQESIACVKNESVRWTWEHFLQHVDELLDLDQFDAVFCASDDPIWVKETWKHQESLPMYVLSDFQTGNDSSSAASDVMSLAHQMVIMSKVDHVIPSVPSSITDHIIRLRLNERGFQQEEQEMFRHYVKATLLAKNKIAE